MNIKSVILVLVLFVNFAAPGFGASLWLNGRDLYSLQGGHEFKVGDIVTVTVSESSTAQQAATTDTNANASVEVKTSPSIPFFSKVVDRFTGKNQVTNTRTGNGTTTRSGKLDGTVTAKVVEIMSNGNLLIEGSRNIRVNKETQLMKIRGVVRPKDIDANNSVASKLLADAEIKYEGKGSVGSTQRPGLMTKISNFLF
ncbi:MAG: flagellar basal body L-ring protein FlgH [Candidatus Riflebacteria bacterium]|nr:flagellar basal body L-ring protein FlgH [Candidatus Riflebacteria bacterium]